VLITEYAPGIFSAIKHLDAILPFHIKDSLSTDANRESVFKAKESAGKSGSFFFFSFDKRFIIKTMNDSELAVFKKALPDYFLHLKNHANSLIARIYGIFTVQREDVSPVHLLLMANAGQTGKDILNVFDLKGSLFNREEKNYQAGTLKDLNLLKLTNQNSFLRFRSGDMK
jgi:1-phosphatidylinositol-4-phosphate 5-kinase